MRNLSILFWVRKCASNKNGLAPIFVRITLKGCRILNFSSGFFIKPEHWNVDKKKVAGKGLESERINSYIIKTEAKLCDIYYELEREDKPISAELIKNIFLGKEKVKLTIFDCLDSHNEKFRLQIEKEGCLSTESLKKYDQLKNKLKQFINIKYHRQDMFVSEINYDFIENFRTWLLQDGHYKKGGLSKDSTTGHLKKLRKIILALFKRGLIKNDPFIDIKLSWENPTSQGLNETELTKLERVVLISDRLNNVLDRFIVGAYSGLAHADISKCTREDLINNFGSDDIWLNVRRKKTGEYCKIPVLPPVQKIIDKYWKDEKCIANNKLFPNISLNSCNEYLKQIGRMAGLPVEVTQKLSTHKSRHTFSQMIMDSGVDIEAIAEILGHSSSRTTRSTYAKTSHSFVATEIKNFKLTKFPIKN